ncbi:MAG: 3-phosphoshikimate 1-carboxyvinyltransferase [Clostridia bacterium]|nr:3-phosphoshikimate 1-carboxyvinyltransferase [Clostridia bacterium]
MNIVIHPGKLRGIAEIPSSKSYAHRLLIAAALSDQPTEVRMNALNDDITATVGCLRALGAQIDRTATGFRVHPIRKAPRTAELFCGESGSTLRFLIPVAAALGVNCTFTGAGRLPERPNLILTEALGAHGVYADNSFLPMTLSGQLQGGAYPIAGNVSSQYITGLLLALPLCDFDSEIVLTTKLESAAYIDITLETLAPFGIRTERTATGWHIPGGQKYRSPGIVNAEGDWSGAAFWHAANRIGSSVDCLGLNENSVQGDRAIASMLSRLGSEINVSDTPDLVPALAVAAAAHPGITRITGAARLRIKESDRLRTVADMLHALGCSADELEDGLVIRGGAPFSGCTIDGCNDHRIVMAAAIAATIADGPVTITDAQAVNKSYPAFFETFNALGGHSHVESDR